ncbi:hypothetical protein AGDE_12030 [Angomonas deanei]|nr:hypothetical protein AGDE_12030 [Angomonas deanei]|eukprot:EPY25080.1 hypothetical protein AGDE_12030 [Angomonas deanei]
MIDPYPLPVAHSLLKILCRADTNLSNTALRLHRIQHTVWDTEASVLLMRILLQARRWDRALEVSEETRKLPDFMALKKRVTSPDAQGMTKEHYTALMLYLNFLSQSLRGCAIGGQSDTASLLFDDVKAVVENMPSATARAKPIQDLSERCRGFFLRAMTKNMMKENSRPKKPVRDDDTHTKEDED